MLRAFFTSSQLDQPTVPWIKPAPAPAPRNWRNLINASAMGQIATSRAIDFRPVTIQHHWQSAIHQLSQQALAGMDWSRLLQCTAQTVTAVLGVPICGIWVVQAHRQQFTCQAIVGTSPPSDPCDLHANCWAADNAQTFQPPLHQPHHGDRQGTQVDPNAPQINLVLPIQGDDTVLGLLAIDCEMAQVFSHDQYAFLQAVAHFLTTAIQRHQAEQLLTIRSVILESIASNADLSAIVLQLCQALETLLPGSRASLIQLDESGQQVMLETVVSLPLHQTESEPYAIAELPEIYGQVIQKKAPFVWDQTIDLDDADPRLTSYTTANAIDALWVMPFSGQTPPSQESSVYGCLTIAHDRPTRLQPAHQRVIRAIAHLATLATENHRNAHKLEKQAMYDGLTGLPNRVYFMKQLSDKLQARQDPFALLFLDVDHFKLVNDSLGHNAGDELLVEITRRLIPCIRRTDIFARLGGDEFAIMLNGVSNVTQAQSIADQIKAVLSLPFKIIDREVFASVSIGIAHSDNYYASPAEIIRDADIAMYRAKSLGRSRAATFDKTMHANVVDRMQIEMELRRVVDQLFLDGTSQLQLYYQPIVSLKSGRIAGFEALIRWMHPERGIVSPLDFIPIAEEIGLIIPIGQWVIQEACQQLRGWQVDLNMPDLSMSINVSSRQFLQTDFLPMVQQILEYTGISPACLKLEITESVLMETANTVIERLEYLRDLGVRLSLDDFGTGYSSLSYLQQFPINTLKVDRSFINTLSEDQDQVVQAIVALTDGLDMDAVAEGIETAEQLAHLRTLGCEYGQGYFFSRPMSRENAEIMLIDNPHWPDLARPEILATTIEAQVLEVQAIVVQVD
jgi:diguanylate cyclase (GGDEF)-like protein